ncbi:MAG: hypothetical protein V7688_11000 [Alcanivorax jadensis]|uniref:hypothetical protein n=1 Tax=Alcanivorax jadensis TaxID=64988 RepID=UPI003002DE2F
MKTKLTIDTNVLGRAMRGGGPLRSKVKAGIAEVFVAETLLTLDGLSKNGKIDLLALKNPRHAFNQSRWDGLIECGVTFLLCPRIGLPRPIGRDGDGNKFEYTLLHKAREHTYSQEVRQERYFKALRYMEEILGAGQAWLRSIESEIVAAGGAFDANEPWFINVASNLDLLGEKAIRKRFGDWADADALAAHYAYGNDLFCTADNASGAGARSILSRANREKLREDLGIRVVSLDWIENGGCI